MISDLSLPEQTSSYFSPSKDIVLLSLSHFTLPTALKHNANGKIIKQNHHTFFYTSKMKTEKNRGTCHCVRGISAEKIQVFIDSQWH